MPFGSYSGNTTSGGTPSRWGGSSSTDNPYSTDKIDNQISNANTRIQDAGYKPENADGRNWFEKVTNLPEKQNLFLDTLELLGRPGSAVKNVIDKSVLQNTNDNSAENPLTAAWKGFSGQDRVTGADLADKMGFKDGVGKFVVGTGLDIGTDPTSYVPAGLIPNGVSSAVKPIGTVAKAGYDALESAAPALKGFRENTLAPAADKTKDALGYMFKPGYKQTETLDGGQSDFLKNLAQDTENSRKYQQEEALNSLVNTAKEAGGVNTGVDVGRALEAPLKQVDEVGNQLSRPIRELPSDPKIAQAATDIIRSNQQIRQLALDNGIQIPEMEGYMTHILSQEERTLRNTNKSLKVDTGSFGQGNPNKKILNQRTLMGSAEDVNDQAGRKLFEPNAYFATGVGQKRLIDYVHSVSLRRQVLSNPEFATSYKEGMVIPNNAVKIDTHNYTFLKDSGDSLEGLGLADKVGGSYIVTKPVKQLLDRYQSINTDEGSKAFIKALDGVTGMWKKLALFSPGFHIRNAAGALFNNYTAGMNTYHLAKYTKEATQEVTNALKGSESKLLNEYRQQGLGSSSLSKVEFAKVGQEPEQAIQKSIEKLSLTGKDKVISKLKSPFQTSQEAGDTIDQVNRFALYKWAREAKGMTPQQAADKVKEVQFDYSSLTPFEQKARKLIPFYTWSRKNIPYQISAFINDPRKYANVNKIRQNAQDSVGLNDQNMPDYMKEQFNIPVYGDKGKGSSLGLNLPLNDLFKLSNPLKTITDGITPLLKTPIELATNFNTFQGKPIEKFQGQTKQYKIPGTDKTVDIPMKLSYALEQLGGQPGRGLSGYFQKDAKSQDQTFRTPTLGMSSVVKPFDAEKSSYLQKVQQLKDLQDMILYIQQQEGTKPRTVSQIKKGSH